LGSGGSGKTSLMLNFFKKKELFRYKFENIYYICPASSFSSVEKHPFANHKSVYHELTVGLLQELYEKLSSLKETNIDEDNPVEYNCIIIDDFADTLKEVEIQKALSKMLIKARHLNCCFIFTLQSFYYMPKLLRKQFTNVTIFKPKNYEEWDSIAKEMFNMKKDDALQLYDYVFDKPYMHIDVDTVENKYYKNFNLLQLTK
jgi:hypoxanthine phosphoribosyltransferase